MDETKSCPICHKTFAPSRTQKYCSDRCRYTANKRKIRLTRQLEGRCPQCGGQMDHPVGTYKDRLSYCSKCRDYYKSRRGKI